MPSFDNVTFKSLGLKHKRDNHLNSFETEMELFKVPGRSGELIIDSGSKLNKDIEVVCNLDCRDLDVKRVIDSINNVFKGERGYKKLAFEDGFIFDAVCKGQIVYNELFLNYFEVSIVFSVKEVE